MADSAHHILWFNQIDKEDVSLVGGKGANLGEITKAGFNVPNGFVVTSHAYYDFIRENNLSIKIKHLLSSANFDDSKSLEQVSKHIKDVINKGNLSKDLVNEILSAYKKLGEPLVAVRSSATAEDLANASFAGQQETFLNIKGDAVLIEKIKEGWASLFDTRAIFYRHQQKFDHIKTGIALVIQKMIESEKSGVMFTIDPVTNDKKTVVIEAILGLGEMIVQGEVNPDHYEVDKEDLAIKNKKIANQDHLLKKSGTTNKKIKLSKKDASKQKITDGQIKALALVGKKIEKHYYFPQDIEWAIEKNNIYIVQTRAVTTTHSDKQKEKTVEHIPASKLILKGDPASPGISSGPVKIVMSAKDIDKVLPGDVLIAPQTNPDYVPAMKKASAIATDSGGRTCFAGDTHVLTTKGFMTMLELHSRMNAGENFLIFAYDHTKGSPAWKKVLSTQKNRLNVIRVSVSQKDVITGNTIDVTPDHKFFTYQQRLLVKKPLKDLLYDSETICLIDSLPVNLLEMSISTKLAYLLGALSTDGNVHLQKGITKWRRGTVTFTQKDCEYKSDFINTVNSYFSEIYSYDMHPRVKHTMSQIRGRVVAGIATDYRCYNLSTTLEIRKLFTDLPLLATTFSEEKALQFLAGVIDGDGSFYRNRIQIYASKQYVYEAVIVSCLRLGIIPQVTTNRTIYNIQILERMSEILSYSKKIKGNVKYKYLGTKLFSARQLFNDISEEVNYKGRIKPYIYKNLLLDARKISQYILPRVSPRVRKELTSILQGSTRMQRVRKIKDLGTIDVYNIEAEATNELDHNFIAFTSRYTPLLVSNSHAAIVSRELGIPAVVGTQGATKKLKNGNVITVDGTKGEIYEGGYATSGSGQRIVTSDIKTATKVYVNLAEPELADRNAKRNVDGIGLLRAEFIMAGIGVHPKKMIKDGKRHEFIEKLASDLAKFCSAFSPRPVVYRASDFKTNEYRNLIGGKDYEPSEPNPMLGYRGAFRYIHDPEVFKLELEAIKHVRENLGYKNLWLMIPFVRTVEELVKVKKIITDFGLHRSDTFKLWMMVEIPSNVIMLDKFIEVGIDGVSIGSNDLTMLVLGTDRDNFEVAHEFDEMNPATLWAFEQTIKTAHKYGITTSMCGQAVSTYPELVKKLVELGVTSVSVSPDAIENTRKLVAHFEKELLNK